MLSHFVVRFRALERNGRLYLISNTVQAMSAGAIGVLYTLYLHALGYGTSFIGVVLFFGVIGAGLALMPAAPLVNRLGWRAMLLWSDWVGGVAIVLQIVMPQPLIIFATTVVAGASFAIVLIVNAPLLTAYSHADERTAVFGLNNALGLLAAVVGSVLGGMLPALFMLPAVRHAGVLAALGPLLASNPTARTYQLAMLAIGASAVPSIIPIYLMHDDHPVVRVQEHTLPRAAGGFVAATAARMERWHGILRAQLVRGRRHLTGVMGRFSLTQALLGFGAGLYAQYLNIYFVDRLHASTAYFGALTALLMIAEAGSSLLAAPFADHFGKIRGSVLALLASLPFLLLLGFAPALAIISLAYLVRGTLTNLSGPPLQAFLMQAVAERSRVVASEAFNVSWQIAGALGVAVGGVLIHGIGYRATFAVAAAFYVASAVLMFIWFSGQARTTPRIHGRLMGVGTRIGSDEETERDMHQAGNAGR